MKAKHKYQLVYHPQMAYSEINRVLYENIREQEDIKTVFEFGCNVGRHLMRLRKEGYDVFGVDVNATSVFVGRFVNLLDKEIIEVGDEKTLADIPDNSFDLVFTNSVLCHIKDISDILEDLKRITRKHLMMVEAPDYSEGKYWYPRDYPGEVKMSRQSAELILYKLYHWKKEES